MTTRLEDARFVRHHIHVEKLAIDKQIFVGELLLPNDSRDVTDKHAFIRLKFASGKLHDRACSIDEVLVRGRRCT